ncbi:MAG: ABC transporter ATP-binding protein [Verrucomicrobia bacterium]|nr:ABC transporter ATP-binding protein [Verrucomicrobiota bacterium]MBV8482591.1 ABC transporter ATP-binding protein [Verrucomicrobiota bacterium]
MPVAIEAHHISKQFFLGERNQRTFFEDVWSSTIAGVQRLVQPGRANLAEHSRPRFWALRDVSFQLHQGETLAIIGENGAGKSTLLKILSRITQPTMGKARVFGRLASLLEVGAGFHPEFSGRDNIYLNGTMLGFSKKEIRQKFDEIVDFSGLEQFIDVPVKNYSSGMYIRLAFSVAANLNPEIVILDEVIAVGDAAFKKKCFERVESIFKQGHTVIMVNHEMAHLRRMSHRCLWLRRGQVEMFGPTNEVVTHYEHEMNEAVDDRRRPAELAGTA